MLSHHPAASAANARGSASILQSLVRIASVLVAATALAGCSTPIVSAGTSDPADPNVPVRSARYSPVLSGYISQRPVGPKPWREQNEGVTPKGSAQ